MKLGELKRMTAHQLGAEYWRLINISKTHPQKSQASGAKNTAQVVLDEFQRRLISGANICIDNLR